MLYSIDNTWYVIVRKDNGYPLQIYTDKNTAYEVAKANNEKVVLVSLNENKGKINE